MVDKNLVANFGMMPDALRSAQEGAEKIAAVPVMTEEHETRLNQINRFIRRLARVVGIIH